MLSLEFSTIINHFEKIEKQLEIQNLIQIVLNPEKFPNFSEKEIENFKNYIKLKL